MKVEQPISPKQRTINYLTKLFKNGDMEDISEILIISSKYSHCDMNMEKNFIEIPYRGITTKQYIPNQRSKIIITLEK